ncbi:MAG: YHS domain-containing (seleno)protein [Chitinophagaceae bacterium]|nr:YHS domain-containing (seleno)protein [Chitinophagaceae bacterium]
MKYIFFILLMGVFTQVAGQEEYSREKQFNLIEGKIAYNGYDAVSYFKKNPQKGNKKITSQYKGINYLFCTEDSKKEFDANPSKYEPAYGGWCAYAMGKVGEKVEVDPTSFEIIDGKVYLFYKSYFNVTLDKWKKDRTSLKPSADKNWNAFVGKK